MRTELDEGVRMVSSEFCVFHCFLEDFHQVDQMPPTVSDPQPPSLMSLGKGTSFLLPFQKNLLKTLIGQGWVMTHCRGQDMW